MYTPDEIQAASCAQDAAAMWWASVLENPRFDNGDTSPGGGMTAAMAVLARGNTSVQTDVLKAFERELSLTLNTMLSGNDGYYLEHGVVLDVDYGPDEILSRCAEKVGFRGGIVGWPWKTLMRVKLDEVKVSYGYGAEPVVIWTRAAE